VYLAKLGYRVSAVDIGTQKSKFRRKLNRVLTSLLSAYNEDKTAAFKRISNRFKVPIDFRCESIDRMSFEADTFDRVFCISVLEHMERKTAQDSLLEMVRVLKPGGMLVLSVDYHPAKRSNNAYTTEDIRSVFVDPFIESGQDIELDLPPSDWVSYIARIQQTFGKRNLHSTFAMVFRKNA
jgi:2-polyprenyl-3-methyl-5-hydroxy-6-metoxy-1,4-benzoquinol methylase